MCRYSAGAPGMPTAPILFWTRNLHYFLFPLCTAHWDGYSYPMKIPTGTTVPDWAYFDVSVSVSAFFV
jgi:hypothetical protein